MSTWISSARRWALALGLTLPLAGCLGAQNGGLNLRAAEALRPGGATSVSFYRGEVVVRAPRGYCVDPSSVQRTGGSRFALLTSCAHLRMDAAHLVPASVITVSVLPRAAGAEQPSAAEMAAAQGGAVLHRVDGDGIALIHLAQGGSDAVGGGAPEHWRAAMVINGHLVGLATYSRPGGAATAMAGRDALINLAEEMRGASPIRLPRGAPDVFSADAPDAPDPAGPAPAAANEAAPKGQGRSFWGGLFQKPV